MFSTPNGVKNTKNKNLYLSCDDLSIQCYTLLIRYWGYQVSEHLSLSWWPGTLIRKRSRYTMS